MEHAPDSPPSDALALQLLETVLESLDACVAVTDPSGEIVQVNRAWRDYQGPNPFLPGGGPGKNYRTLCQDLLKSADAKLSIVALGIISILNGNVPRLNLDYPLSAEGESRWFSMVGTRASSAGLGAVVQHRDITRRMTMEQRLRRSESLFRLTTENARDLISILEVNGQLRYHSPSHRRALGYNEVEMAAMEFRALVHPADWKDVVAQLKVGAREGLTPLFEYRMKHKDGSYGHFEAQAAVVEQRGGESESVLLISRDITKRKESELERDQMEIQLRHGQKMEAVGQLAAGIAHEINTPIQFIGDNLDFLSDAFQSLARLAQAAVDLATRAAGVPDLAEAAADFTRLVEQEDLAYLVEEAPQAIHQSADGVERVASIVRAMKVFSHPNSEGWSALDVNQALETTLVVCRSEWKYVAEIEKHLDPGLPNIIASAGELNQVFLNLLVNASHAIADTLSKRGGGKGLITVTTSTVEGGVEVRVADDGVGIPPDVLPRIWLPFFTTKPVGKGTGQGLSIVHSVVSRHGGTADVESELGRGTCFILRLPLRPKSPESAPA